jgi:hypothetical protein
MGFSGMPNLILTRASDGGLPVSARPVFVPLDCLKLAKPND